MIMSECDCYSIQTDHGSVYAKTLYRPKDLNLRTCTGELKESVAVDNCIAHVVEHLWSNGVITYGSCCGHNKNAPEIIIKDKSTTVDKYIVAKIISEVDTRKFLILSWQYRPVLFDLTGNRDYDSYHFEQLQQQITELQATISKLRTLTGGNPMFLDWATINKTFAEAPQTSLALHDAEVIEKFCVSLQYSQGFEVMALCIEAVKDQYIEQLRQQAQENS